MAHELLGALDRIEKAVFHAQRFTQSDSVSLCGGHIDVSTEYDIEQALRDIKAIRDAVPKGIYVQDGILKIGGRTGNGEDFDEITYECAQILHAITSEASDE